MRLMTTTVPEPPHDPSIQTVLLAAAAGAVVAAVMVTLGVLGLKLYGGMLFVATPLAMGVTAGFALNARADASGVQTMAALGAMFALSGVGFLLFAVEGLICLLMSLPLAAPMSFLGAKLGRQMARGRARPATLFLGLLVLPLGAGAEVVLASTPMLREVLSVVEIDAEPDRVWSNVIEFPQLAEPAEWWFKAGLAYPRYASIEGRGVGAVRSCVFSTGAFIEPITAWEPGRRLAFDVAESPAPLRELSPYGNIHPPHLDGYFRSRRGEFRLVALPGGRTQLEGRTWYELDMAPLWYWQWMTDRVIHSIHLRVLDHIKRESERD